MTLKTYAAHFQVFENENYKAGVCVKAKTKLEATKLAHEKMTNLGFTFPKPKLLSIEEIAKKG